MRWVPYASTPGRLARQVVADALVLVWVVLAVRAGRRVHDAVAALSEPGARLEGGADGLADQLRGAGERAQDVPFVGDELAEPLDRAGGAADQVAAAGGSFASGVQDLADVLGVAIAALAILVVLAAWLPARVRFAARAGAARRVAEAGDSELLALRALVTQPLPALARLSDDPVADWRRGDPELVRRLAALQLRSIGLRPPPH